MADFEFIQKPLSHTWTILDPRRSSRPDVAHEARTVCPFCVGREGDEEELDRIAGDTDDWLVRVIPNKFPFAPHHELIIHSPDHHKNFDELPYSQVVEIVRMYQKRYKVHQPQGQVVLFHNRGERGGESIPHPHTQLVVIPAKVKILTPTLRDLFVMPEGTEPIETEHFFIFCPKTSEWPDEVVIAPKNRKNRFGGITERELEDLAHQIQFVLQTLSQKIGEEFSFNHYVYPLFDWYLRIVPRYKTLGGFEIATNISVMTQDPSETLQFLKSHKEEGSLGRV